MTALNWSLVLSTRNRATELRRCLELAAAQTRPPAEVIVIDASDSWEASRDWVSATLAPRHPSIRWLYEPARRRSLPAQRNQGIMLASGDVLFLIDDDAYMYGDCAAEVMAVYEADPESRVAAVSMVSASQPPDLQTPPSNNSASAFREPRRRRLFAAARQSTQRLKNVETRFPAYDGAFHRHELPNPVRRLPVLPIPLMNGFRMTVRRPVALREPFSNILDGYAAGEDLDASYRMSRHGALVRALNARICHIQSASGRLPRSTVAALLAMNMVVVSAMNSLHPAVAARRCRQTLLRNLVVDALIDLARGRFSLPDARGAWMGLRHLNTIFEMESRALADWYPAFQRELMGTTPPSAAGRPHITTSA